MEKKEITFQIWHLNWKYKRIVKLTENTTRGPRNNMLSIIELTHIFTYICPTNTCMALNI